jgi:hypothetical protein
MQDRLKLGEILVQAGIIDEMQLTAALGEQQRWGRRLGVTLVKMGMVEEDHLMRALAKQLDLPVASLVGKRIAEDVIALVPARVASEHGVIPLFVKRADKGVAQLFLGMEDPSDIEVLDDLAFRTGLEIHPVMVTPSDLGAAIDRYYYAKAGAASGREVASAASGEAMGIPSLHRVEGDPAPPASVTPFEPVAAEHEAPQREPEMPASRDTVLEPEPEPELDFDLPVAPLPEHLLDDVARAIDETERTRIVVKAVAQLLIDKGVLGLEEIQGRIAQLKSVGSTEGSTDA